MKQYPILFSTPLISQIQADVKTQTRRIVKTKKNIDGIKNPEWGYTAFTPEGHISVRGIHPSGEFGESFIKCPYGSYVGQLYVRESWRIVGWDCESPNVKIEYKDGTRQMVEIEDPDRHEKYCIQSTDQCLDAGLESSENGFFYWRKNEMDCPTKWRPSIFMPREASRITLEITDIRVERLQDITEEDAQAEGVQRDGDGWKGYEIIEKGPHKGKSHPFNAVPYRNAVFSFESLWQSINGQGSWEKNPWVWVIKFWRVKP